MLGTTSFLRAELGTHTAPPKRICQLPYFELGEAFSRIGCHGLRQLAGLRKRGREHPVSGATGETSLKPCANEGDAIDHGTPRNCSIAAARLLDPIRDSLSECVDAFLGFALRARSVARLGKDVVAATVTLVLQREFDCLSPRTSPDSGCGGESLRKLSADPAEEGPPGKRDEFENSRGWLGLEEEFEREGEHLECRTAVARVRGPEAWEPLTAERGIEGCRGVFNEQSRGFIAPGAYQGGHCFAGLDRSAGAKDDEAPVAAEDGRGALGECALDAAEVRVLGREGVRRLAAVEDGAQLRKSHEELTPPPRPARKRIDEREPLIEAPGLGPERVDRRNKPVGATGDSTLPPGTLDSR
jgi:hypothetical protein